MSSVLMISSRFIKRRDVTEIERQRLFSHGPVIERICGWGGGRDGIVHKPNEWDVWSSFPCSCGRRRITIGIRLCPRLMCNWSNSVKTNWTQQAFGQRNKFSCQTCIKIDNLWILFYVSLPSIVPQWIPPTPITHAILSSSTIRAISIVYSIRLLIRGNAAH